jgi:hypothetical protein
VLSAAGHLFQRLPVELMSSCRPTVNRPIPVTRLTAQNLHFCASAAPQGRMGSPAGIADRQRYGNPGAVSPRSGAPPARRLVARNRYRLLTAKPWAPTHKFPSSSNASAPGIWRAQRWALQRSLLPSKPVGAGWAPWGVSFAPGPNRAGSLRLSLGLGLRHGARRSLHYGIGIRRRLCPRRRRFGSREGLSRRP